MNGHLACIAPFCRCAAPADRYPAGWRVAVRAFAAADAAARQRFLVSQEAQASRPGPDLHPLEAARRRAVVRLLVAQEREARLWRICKRRSIEAAGRIG